MPHITVKLWPGRSKEQKKKLAKSLADAAKKSIGASESSLSVTIEEINRDKWIETVYYPEIERNRENLYKSPGYKPEDI